MDLTAQPSRFIPRAADYLQGRSPRARAIEKQHQVVRWLHVWGCSGAEEIRRVAGQEARGYAPRLNKVGLLTSTRTECGGVLQGVPRDYYTLSAVGLAEAERIAKTQFRYPELDPFKVNQRLLRHNLLTQRLTLDAMRDGHIVGFKTERQWATEDARPQYKRPDVLWIDEAGQITGVEVELTGKWERDLDDFVDGIVMELVMSGLHKRTLQKFLIATDSKALAERYRQALEPGAKYRTWVKDQNGRWRQKEENEVPDLIEGLIEVRLLEDR